jgi:hypothetical protein
MSGTAPAIEKPGTPVSILSISAPQVRALLAQYHDFLITKAVANEGKDRQKAENDLASLDKLLALMQQVQIVTSFGPGHTSLFLTIGLAGGR